jgi:amidase
MLSEQIDDLNATAQAALVARGEVSAAEAIEAAVERIERLNPVFNCVIFPRYERACAEARALAADAASSFAGVPFLMKDLIQTCRRVRLACESRFIFRQPPRCRC